jgi:hypothetical protein
LRKSKGTWKSVEFKNYEAMKKYESSIAQAIKAISGVDTWRQINEFAYSQFKKISPSSEKFT